MDARSSLVYLMCGAAQAYAPAGAFPLTIESPHFHFWATAYCADCFHLKRGLFVTRKAKDTRLLSIIVPLYNEEDGFEILMAELLPVLETVRRECDILWEILFVDDGSTDGTQRCIEAWAAKDERIRGLVLSRNFGKEAAMTAGLEHALGNAVIPMDADLQDPPELILEMVGKWLQGAETVVGIRSDRDTDTAAKRLSSTMFYYVFNKLAQRPIPANAGDFRLMDEKVVKAVLQMNERNRFMKGIFSWVGFKTEYVHYSRGERKKGTSKWNYRRLFHFALDGVTSFSTVPLRIWSGLGFFIALFAFLCAFWIIIKTLIFGDPVQGYPSLIVAILFLGGLQLLGIGIIGEYLGRLYQESKKRPLYIVHHGINAKTTGTRGKRAGTGEE